MKKSHIYVNSILADTIKKDFGMNLNVIVEKFLESIINGELQYSNGHWKSVFMRTEIETPILEDVNNEVVEEDINNEPVEECVKSVPEKKQELAMPSWADCEKYYRDADNMYRYLKDADFDIISDLKSIFQKPIEETDEKNFDKSACEKFFIAIYGLDRKWGDDYNEEPDIYEDSLYNYFKRNNRLKVVARFDSIKKQAIGLMKEVGIDY